MNWKGMGLAIILIFFLCVLEDIAGMEINNQFTVVQGIIIGFSSCILVPNKKKY